MATDLNNQKTPLLLLRLEWAVAIVATLLAIWLHLVNLNHAGGLWRDEANSVAVAGKPTLGEMWRVLNLNSFPGLFPLLTRGWLAVGFHSDFALRCLGFGIGLSVLASLWFFTRSMGRGVPLLSLGLLAINFTTIRWGDCLRAYGLGSALIVVAVAAIWKLAGNATARNFWFAAVTAVLSVQCLYQNAFILIAACAAAWVYCWRRSTAKPALLVLATGSLAALSLAPYGPMIVAAQSWYAIAQVGFSAGRLWITLKEALGNFWIAWIFIVVTALAVGGAALVNKKYLDDARLFCLLTFIGAVGGFGVFLGFARLPTQSWYWLPLMIVVAASLDGALAGQNKLWRGGRVAVAGLLILFSVPSVLQGVKFRQTNVDLIAARLAVVAGPNDLIIVHPWYCGVTFSRYYKGDAAWTTLPQLTDHTLHRYDLLKEQLVAERPARPVFERVVQTLNAGHRVWLVGMFKPPPPGQPPLPDLPPAPNGPYGWFDGYYSYVWGSQLISLVLANAAEFQTVPVEQPPNVNRFEKLPVFVATGRKQ